MSKAYRRLQFIAQMLRLPGDAPGHTRKGVPVLRLSNEMDICYFGTTHIFRVFDAIACTKIADFNDDGPGRGHLVRFIEARWR